VTSVDVEVVMTYHSLVLMFLFCSCSPTFDLIRWAWVHSRAFYGDFAVLPAIHCGERDVVVRVTAGTRAFLRCLGVGVLYCDHCYLLLDYSDVVDVRYCVSL